MSVAGSGASLSTPRGHLIFIGSQCAAISGPTMSAQWVTSSTDAKPWRANVSARVARTNSASGRAVVERHGGRFPAHAEALRALPGIGAYTANAIAAIAFDRLVSPVDGNIERVVARLHAVEMALPAAKLEIHRLAAGLTPASRPG